MGGASGTRSTIVRIDDHDFAPAGATATSRPVLDVGLLSFEYPPSSSGLPRAAREIAQSLAEAGQRVRVLTLDRDGRTRDGAVEVIGRRIGERSRLGVCRRIAGFGHLVAPWAFRSLVMEEHRRRPFDLLEASNWYAPAALLAGFGPVPLVTRNSTPAAAGCAARQGLRNRLDGRCADWLEARTARASAALISNTEAHRERIRQTYRLGAHPAIHSAIPPPVDPAVLARGARVGYPGDDQRLRLLFVGRPDHRKGFDALTDAIVSLVGAGRDPSFVVHMVGVTEAMLPASLRMAPVRAVVRPLGRLDDRQLHDEFRRAHAVIAPSRSESFGYVYQEALAFGRPVIACSEDASARRFIGEPGAGLLVSSCTGEDVAGAIRQLQLEPGLRHVLRTRAQAAAGACTRATCATATLAVYRAVIGARAAPARRV